MTFWLGTFADAITAVAVLALVSVGLYITYGVLRVINLAHGDMMTLGAYITVFACRSGLPFALAVAVATLTVGLLGLVVEATIIRPLHSRDDLSTLLATWGLGLVITEAIRIFVGPSGEYVDLPTTTVVHLWSVPYPLYSVYLVALSVLILAGLGYCLTSTRAGLVVRAVIENPTLAALRGFRVTLVRGIAFGIGAGLTGLAGAVVGPISAITPTMGVEFAMLAFMVAIIAGPPQPAAARARGRIYIGLAVLLPCVAAATLVGGSRSILSSLLGVTTATFGMLAITIAMLLSRPNGILGTR
jgi:branched-subunit amino acid ABC-type transport system permease component